MTEPRILVAFLERLAARPIPQISGEDRTRLHEAASELRAVAAKRANAAAGRATYAKRRIARKVEGDPLELGAEA